MPDYDTMYTVHGSKCECPDSRRHADDMPHYHCTHSIAVLCMRTLDSQEQESL